MFYQQLSALCSDRDIKITNLVSILGISSGNLSKWKAGGTPKGDTLVKVADYFGVSVDYLLGRTPTPSPARQVESTFTPAEQELVGRYRRASGDDRAIVDMALRKYASPSRTQSEQVG